MTKPCAISRETFDAQSHEGEAQALAAGKGELDRLIEDAIVDASGESEQWVGFYTMLEERLGSRGVRRGAMSEGGCGRLAHESD
jgi:hypothetical protein